ncbi:MAG: GTP-binding protein [Candidatus Atribacteria bacterium]|nr:GTP-binding protein [Candidatus Atribacteria bacterium]
MTELMFKVTIFGDGGVGKTTLVNRYLTGNFNENMTMTIGVNFYIKEVIVNGQKVKLQIWDFAGERRFRTLFQGYVRGSMGGIFMYDVTRYTSLTNVQEWVNLFHKGTKKHIPAPLYMLGGKADLEEKRSVPREDAMKTAETYGFTGFNECSAKSGQNVQKAFETLAELILKQKQQSPS